MRLVGEISAYELIFNFQARTSRGTIHTKPTHFVKIYDADHSELFGIGECSWLEGLSPENPVTYATDLHRFFREMLLSEDKEDFLTNTPELDAYPSIRFGLETAWKDFLQGGKRQIFNTAFVEKEKPIPINGLIWMGNTSFMLEQIEKKLQEGFSCLKLKIGGIDFDDECQLLQHIRSLSSVTIRLDANGAFSPKDALKKLQQLAKYEIHSIEQPIKPLQWEEMHQLCRRSPIPIALDEELIGIMTVEKKAELLEKIRPSYLILKPSLMGGVKGSIEWIELAKKYNIGYWMTSALESNVGLNAISQFADTLALNIPQGLGTGQLYRNNIPSPLEVRQGNLYYSKSKTWDFSAIQYQRLE